MTMLDYTLSVSLVGYRRLRVISDWGFVEYEMCIRNCGQSHVVVVETRIDRSKITDYRSWG